MATSAPPSPLPDIEPLPTLLSRLRAELREECDANRPIRISRAPGRLDVMGGIADYTGSMVCEMPLDRAAGVALQEREDRQLQIFSFNLYDQHKPFTFRISIDALAEQSVELLRREFNESGRKWAAYVAGCLVALYRKLPTAPVFPKGINVAIYSIVPLGAGVSSSAALEVATMINLRDHLGLKLSPIELAELCQWAENHIVGAPCGIMDQVTSCVGEAGTLLRMICQPHEVLPTLKLPDGVRVIGINSNVKHDVGGPAYGRTRCAAFMGYKIILEQMREMGKAVGREMIADPMRGYLANCDPDDYKQFFRPQVPELICGRDFLSRYGPTADDATQVEEDIEYQVRHATDHHVLEARRVRRFGEFLESAASQETSRRKLDLDRCGHLMYASHQSYGMDAMLGAPECDLLVDLVRRNEGHGLYGARITGGGSGGTVAVLCNSNNRADEAIEKIMNEYEARTRQQPELFRGSSDGAWKTGSQQITL